VASDRILIPGLRALGVHGVLPEEHERPQPFEVDVELVVDTAAAGASDDLADTVDYSAVCEAVVRVITAEHHQLLERLAERIADVCRADDRVHGVVVEVRKLHPPVRAQVRHVAVRVER
jgi:dihydroneopterin aldolase